MKLNDKSLSKFAGSGAPPDKEGYLHKRGDFHKSKQKRWCVLKGNLLFYYEKRVDKDPIGVIVLEGCTIELSDHEDGFTFMIHFPGSASRTYIMIADTQEEMESWMKVLSCASYDYIKVCVNELKHQLNNLDSNSKKLVQSAVMDKQSIGKSMAAYNGISSSLAGAGAMSSSSSNNSVSSRRRNPFDTGESFESVDRESMTSSTEKQARTFLEMHNEFREQIEEIQTEWRNKQKLIVNQPPTIVLS